MGLTAFPSSSIINVATARLIGRATAGTGAAEELTAAQVKTLLALVPGTDVQAFHANLSALAGLIGAADKGFYFTGSGAMALMDLSSFARTIMDDTTAMGVRTTLGIDSDDAVTFGDVTCNNLVVNGTSTTINTASITVDDPLIRLADNNAADSVDVGWYGTYVDSGTKYAGVFRDATDGKFKVFSVLTAEPTTTVNTGAGFELGTLVCKLESNEVTITGGAISGLSSPLPVASGGSGSGTAGGALTNFGLTANGQSIVTAANYAAMRALLDLEPNTDFYAPGGTDVPVADGGTGSSTAAGAATNLGLGTGDSPQFTGVNLGHASDTTLTRVAEGAIAIEGKIWAEPSAALVGSYHLLMGQPSPNRWHHSWLSCFTTTSINHAGGLEVSFVGTVSTPGITTTTFRTSRPRFAITGAAGAGSVAHIRSTNRHIVWRGNAAGLGGWYLVSVVGVQTAIAGSIYMLGLMEASAFVGATTEASANIDAVFLGWDSGDSNCQIMHNDSAGTCTKIDLGANFPARTANCIYQLFLFAEPNGSAIYYQVNRLDSAFIASGTLSANLPTAGTLLHFNHYESNNATATAPVLNHYKTDIWQPWQ